MGQRRKALKKSHGRNVAGTEGVADQQEKNQVEQKGIVEAAVCTIRHFFGGFSPLFSKVVDRRDPQKITYPLASLAFAGMLMFLCRLGARRQVGLLLRNGPSTEKFAALFHVDSFPHGDTLDDAFSQLDPDQGQEVVCALMEKLIRKKVLYPERVLDKYFVIAMDGSGTLTFSERHCSHCLTATHNGKTLYFHKVLEAKLVTPSGFAFSIMTEFIENLGENPTKQDCELKAFYRLAARLKERFPRLPILLSLDGLFAGGPTFEICRKYGWQYMIVLKDQDLPSVNQEFETLSKLLPQNRFSCRPVKDAEISQCYRWVENISYVDTDRRYHTLSVIECLETKRDEKGVIKTNKFKWVTCLPISAKTVAHLANNGGRIRWKVENEGFNVQKNGGYGLEHAYTSNSTSAKIFYFLLQIAHMVAQLLDRGNLLRNLIPAGFGSAKNLAFRLLEAWRNARITAADMQALLARRFQIRLNDSS